MSVVVSKSVPSGREVLQGREFTSEHDISVLPILSLVTFEKSDKEALELSIGCQHWRDIEN